MAGRSDVGCPLPPRVLTPRTIFLPGTSCAYGNRNSVPVRVDGTHRRQNVPDGAECPRPQEKARQLRSDLGHLDADAPEVVGLLTAGVQGPGGGEDDAHALGGGDLDLGGVPRRDARAGDAARRCSQAVAISSIWDRTQAKLTLIAEPGAGEGSCGAGTRRTSWKAQRRRCTSRPGMLNRGKKPSASVQKSTEASRSDVGTVTNIGIP